MPAIQRFYKMGVTVRHFWDNIYSDHLERHTIHDSKNIINE
jgi:hypothetical protein